MTRHQCYRVNCDRQYGFSLFEMVVVVLLIGVLVTLAIDRLIQLQVETEKISVRHVIGALDSAVYVQTAEIVLKQGLEAMRQMENTNPMNYLGERPFNYRGVKTGVAATNVPVENWYFDPVSAELVYKVRNAEYFVSEIQGDARIRLKLSLVYRDDIDSDSAGTVQGVRLKKLHDYSWKLTE